MALVANSNRDPKRRPQAYTVEDFNPYILTTTNPPAVMK